MRHHMLLLIDKQVRKDAVEEARLTQFTGPTIWLINIAMENPWEKRWGFPWEKQI